MFQFLLFFLHQTKRHGIVGFQLLINSEGPFFVPSRLEYLCVSAEYIDVNVNALVWKASAIWLPPFRNFQLCQFAWTVRTLLQKRDRSIIIKRCCIISYLNFREVSKSFHILINFPSFYFFIFKSVCLRRHQFTLHPRGEHLKKNLAHP